MTITIKKGYKQLIAEAEALIETMTIEESIAAHAADTVLVLDIRDVRERKRTGFIPNSVHMPRGMLEFWADPESPYYRDEFATDKKLLLHCASAWRSALAARALFEMGYENVAHVGGGFTAWLAADAPVEGAPNSD